MVDAISYLPRQISIRMPMAGIVSTSAAVSAAIAMCVLTALPAWAQTYSDATFNDADWSSAVLGCSTAGSAVTVRQDFSEGAAPPSRTTVHQYQGGNPGVLVTHMRRGASYTPSSQGAIASLSYSYDLRHYTGPSQWAVAYSPLIVQNGRQFRLRDWDGVFPDEWTRFGRTVGAADFVELCDPFSNVHPDFSCTGSRMDFGYATGNSNPNVPSPFQDRSSGLDNWYLEVQRAGVTVSLTADPPLPVCSGAAVTLTAQGSAPFRWSSNTGATCTDCASITVQPSATTTYQVTCSDGTGCDVTAAITVEVRQPVPTHQYTTICNGDFVRLQARPGTAHQWSPAAGLSCTTCDQPLAAPSATTTYMVAMLDTGGCPVTDTFTVTLQQPRTLTVGIAPGIRSAPGVEMLIPVVLLGTPDPGQITTFDLTLTYPPDMLRVNDIATAGTLTQGWQVDLLQHDRHTGRSLARLSAPGGAWLAGNDTLLFVKATAFVGSAEQMQVDANLVVPNADCLALQGSAGIVRLDSICGLQHRLIEWDSGSFALDGSHPNPFNPSTTITFSIGLDGPTTLDILNQAGDRVARLLDSHLEAGRYALVWDATAQPSGVYYCRVRSGTWVAQARMVLVK